MTVPQAQLNQFGWLVDDFVNRVPGVAHAVVVSADGLLLTASAYLPRTAPTSWQRCPPA